MDAGVSQVVGREEEVASLLDLLDAPDQLPSIAVITGEPGIGKTALWLAAVDLAAARGFQVLSSRPTQAEAGFSFLALTDMLGEVVGDVLPELPPVQREALEAALLLGDSALGADPRSVAAAFLGALRLLSAERTLCLAVDDVQWLDAASLSAIRYAVARLRHERVATVLAVRDEVPEWVSRAVDESRLRTVRVRGLSLGATHELLRNRLDATFARPVLMKLWQASGGNPFFALELGAALQRRGGTLDAGEDLPIPTALDQLLHVRLDALGTEALDVASAVAALADPTMALVEAVVGDGYEAGLAETLAASIIEADRERLRFTHPLLGSAVAVRLAPSRRRDLHARLAEVVPTAEERARHLALATVDPDRATAAILENASHAAHERGAPAGAADLAEQALRLTPAADTADINAVSSLPPTCTTSPAPPTARLPFSNERETRHPAASSGPRLWFGLPTCRTTRSRPDPSTARRSPKRQETMRSRRPSTSVSLCRWPGAKVPSRVSHTPGRPSPPPRGPAIPRSNVVRSQPTETGTSGPAGACSRQRWTVR